MKRWYLLLLIPFLFISCYNIDTVVFTFDNQSLTDSVTITPEKGEDWDVFTLNFGEQTQVESQESALFFTYTTSGGPSALKLTPPADGNRTYTFTD